MQRAEVEAPQAAFQIQVGDDTYDIMVEPWDTSDGPLGERGFVYGNWNNSIVDGPEGRLTKLRHLETFAYLFRTPAKDGSMPNVGRYLISCRTKALCTVSHVYVASILQDGLKSSQIGFVCFSQSMRGGACVHYLYVIPAFRECGVAGGMLDYVGIYRDQSLTYSTTTDIVAKLRADGKVPNHWMLDEDAINRVLRPGAPHFESNPEPLGED